MPPTSLRILAGLSTAQLAPPSGSGMPRPSPQPRPSLAPRSGTQPPIQCKGQRPDSSGLVDGVHRLFKSGMTGGRLPHSKTIQRSFGPYDISGITASSGASARRANRMMGSEAMTRGEQIAFKGPTSLHIAAHEAAHVLQHRSGLRLPGGIGRTNDQHERFADKVALGVTSGRSVTGLLDRTVGPKARHSRRPRSDAPVQMYTKIKRSDQTKVKDRITARGGTGTTVNLEDSFYTGSKGRGLVASNVASMARDTAFENVAQRFEQGIGVLAYKNLRTELICKRAGAKVLAYFNAKYQKSSKISHEIDQALMAMGISNPGWSGAVGKSARAVRKVLENGSVNERAAHIETFVKDILATDIMENEINWRGFAKTAGYDMSLLGKGYENVAFTGDRYLIFNTDKDSATGMQWHTRAKMEDVRKKTKDDRFHPSSVKAPTNLDEKNVDLKPHRKKKSDLDPTSVTVRTVDRIEHTGPSGLGITLGEGEKGFQERSNGDKQRLAWVEGARLYALNELDGWVYAQRQLSLPLVAGTSSTSARIVQSFNFLKAGDPDDARLVALGTMLIGRHHSIVEVMEGAKGYGTSTYREGPMMYHDLAPLTDEEIRHAGLEFPDEYVDPNGKRGGFSFGYDGGEKVQDEPQDEIKLGGLLGLSRRQPVQRKGRKDKVDEEIKKLTCKGRPKEFKRNRGTIKSSLNISNTFTNRNSAQARMLKAVDAYHSTQDIDVKLHHLAKVRDEAAHWLIKHPKWLLGKSASRRRKFMLLRDEAQAVIQTHIDADEAAYLTSLKNDELFAPSEHSEQAMSVLTSSRSERVKSSAGQLVSDHGLSLAEIAAIKVYSGPAYKFINPALEGDTGSINRRLLGFVREIKLATNNNKNSATRIKESEEARQKLIKSKNPVKTAIEEGELHARHAIRGLSKLPPFTGMVYAGGALPKAEALARFKTGETQVRKSFASTSSQQFTASIFAMNKGDKLKEAYESIPERDRDESQAPFPFMLRYPSKTGRDIQHLAIDSGEQEVLFIPGTKLKILRGADDPKAEKKVSGNETIFTYIDAMEVT